MITKITNPDRKSTIWVFRNSMGGMFHEVGIGGLGFGYFRVSLDRRPADMLMPSLRLQGYPDSYGEVSWQAFRWAPFGRRVFGFRHYYLTASHVFIGPVCLSWVRNAYGPTGPVYTLGIA